jgi:hypothetical protein
MKYLFFLGAIAVLAVLVFNSCKTRSKGIPMHQLLEDDMLGGKRIIVATRMKGTEVSAAIDDFIELSAKNGNIIDRPVVRKQENGAFFICLPDSTTYDQFCYWVNYLVYSNADKRYNNNITGWYEVASGAKGVWEAFAGQRLMVYVPETDTEYDNVYLTTQSNACYKQEFARRACLIQQSNIHRDYSDIPTENEDAAD